MEKDSHREMERVNVWSTNIYHAMQRQWNTERNLILRLSQLPSSLPHLAHILSIIVISGDSAFPGPGLLSKF